jgi:hypothetical protein
MARKTRAATPEPRGRNVGKTAAIVAGIGAACALAAGALFRLRRNADEKDRPAPALSGDAPPGPVGSSGAARNAGRKQMRDPPKQWDEVDEASDGSFPASDPPNLAQHVD